MGVISKQKATGIAKKQKTAAKRLWRGVFNFRHQIIVRYLQAYSAAQAKVLMMRRIAHEQDVPYAYVFGLFDGSIDNFEITEEKEGTCK